MVTCKHPIGRDERTGYTLLTTAMWEMFANQVDKSKVAVQKALEETQLLFDSLMQQYFG